MATTKHKVVSMAHVSVPCWVRTLHFEGTEDESASFYQVLAWATIEIKDGYSGFTYEVCPVIVHGDTYGTKIVRLAYEAGRITMFLPDDVVRENYDGSWRTMSPDDVRDYNSKLED